jgi:hypothetical protein
MKESLRGLMFEVLHVQSFMCTSWYMPVGTICQSEHWECELHDEVLSGSATLKNRSQALLMNLWFIFLF